MTEEKLRERIINKSGEVASHEILRFRSALAEASYQKVKAELKELREWLEVLPHQPSEGE